MSLLHNSCPSPLDHSDLLRWFAKLTGICPYQPREAVSWLFGCLSILSWMFAQLPQIATNYKNRSVVGLSLAFLVSWFLGDITNLLGCLLTDQLAFQTMLARYYLFVDFVLLCQYAYYSFICQPCQHDLSTRTGHINPEFSRSPASLLLFVASPSAKMISQNQGEYNTTFSKDLGRIFSWTCAAFYLSSRLPQLWKNYMRKSCSGLSLGLFVAAFLGNLFYTLSILTSLETTRNPQYLYSALPFILGAAGTLVFDMAIFIQWICYNQTFNEKGIEEQEYLLSRSSGLCYSETG